VETRWEGSGAEGRRWGFGGGEGWEDALRLSLINKREAIKK